MKRNINALIEKMLQDKGATKIKFYMLINNDGFTFEYKGKRYDLRHWRNAYGASCNFWDCMIGDHSSKFTDQDKEFMKAVKDAANHINRGR